MIVLALIAALVGGCSGDKRGAQPSVDSRTTAATGDQSAAFSGEEGEYYVIAYVSCGKKLAQLAVDYGVDARPESVAKAHAALYGNVESRGAYRGCLDAIHGSKNKVWVAR